MASPGPFTGRRIVQALIYRAEAYRETDRLREPVWDCPHEHRTIEGALNCGQEWMGTQPESA